MSRKDTLRRIDQGIAAASGGATVSVTLAGGPGGVSNADTVDGLHAAPSPQPGKLLALDSLSRFPTSVINWSAVDHNALDNLAAGNPHTQYVNAAGSGLSLAAQVLSVVTGTGIKIDTGAVALDAHTHQTAAQGGTLDHGLALTGLSDDDHTLYARVAPPTTARNVIQAGAVDVTPLSLRAFSAAQSAALWKVEDSGGNTLIRVNQTGDLESAGFQSGIRGWRVDHAGTAEFQNAYIRGELHATVFVKDLIEAHAGTLGIFKSGGKLHADLTTPAVGATATLTVTDPPGGGFLFSAGDWVRIKAEHASGVYDVWGQVTSPVDNGDGTQSYTYTHRSGTVGAVVSAGVAVADYGASGQGYLIATADMSYAPYLDVASWAGANPYTGSNHTAHVRLGQLRGITGANEWGLWAGSSATRYLKVADTGALLHGLPQTWVDGAGNVRGQVLPDATGTGTLFWLGPSSSDRRLTVRADGTVLFGNVPSTTLDGWRYGSTTSINGGAIEAGTLSAQQVTISPHNMIANAGFEIGSGSNVPGWARNQLSPVINTIAHTGSKSLGCAANGQINTNVASQTFTGITPGDVFYVEGWMRMGGNPPANAQAGFTVRWLDSNNANIATNFFLWTSRWSWSKRGGIVTAPAGAASVAIFLDVRDSCDSTTGVNWDDFVCMRASSVGLHIYDPASAGGYIRIVPEEIAGFNSSDKKQFYLRSSDGRAMFGGGKGVLDSSGLVLSGNETSYNTFNAIRWMTEVDPPGGNQVARIGAGRWGGLSNYYELLVETNPDLLAGYPSDIVLRTNTKSASATGNGREYIRGGLYLSSQIIQASAILATEVDEGEGNAAIQVIGESTNSYIKFVTKDTERFRILHNGRIGVGTSAPAELLEVEGCVRAQSLMTDGGSDGVKWRLGAASTASDAASTRRVYVNIGGTGYYLLAIAA